MQEIIEQAINSPQLKYVVQNPGVVVAGGLAGSIAAGSIIAIAGQINGEREIQQVRGKEDLEDYKQFVFEKNRYLADQLNEEDIFSETINHLAHCYLSGKKGAYGEEVSRIKGLLEEQDFPNEEFYEQIFTDMELEYLR